MLKIKVIIGSTRPDRFGDKPGVWVAEEAKKKGLDVEVLDLRDYPLPFFNEKLPTGALNGNYSVEIAKQWSEKIREADGFIMTVAEYNHGYTAVLKNAIDYGYSEWFKKPVGFVSYGVMGGISASDQLKQVVTQLQMMPVPGVHISDSRNALDAEGKLDAKKFEGKADNMLNQLVWWGEALKTARDKDAAAK
jgi:NAD(P)H-dependent FMN reductase